jgi:hypothetical protein
MSNIDWDYIRANEDFKTKGYIPRNSDGTVMGNSGVTIGTGVDLGSKNDAYFAGLPETLVAKLRPYYGKMGAAAKKAFDDNPALILTKDEANSLDAHVKRAETNQIRTHYRNATGKSFDDLPQYIATPAASVLFQYGSGNPAVDMEDFWNLLIADEIDIPAMEKELREFDVKKGKTVTLYPERRYGDAGYLKGNSKDVIREDLANIIKNNSWQGTAAELYATDVGGINVDLPTPKQKPTPPQFPTAASDLVDQGRIQIPELEGAYDSSQLPSLASDPIERQRTFDDVLRDLNVAVRRLGGRI